MKSTLVFAGTIKNEINGNDKFRIRYQFCKFKLKNGDIEFAKNCIQLDKNYLVTTCAERTCITSTVTEISKPICNKPSPGNPSFSFSILTQGHNDFPNLLQKIKNYCEKSELKVKARDAQETLRKRISGQYRTLILPNDEKANFFVENIVNTTCMKNALVELGIDYIVTSEGDKNWADLHTSNFKAAKDIFDSCN